MLSGGELKQRYAKDFYLVATDPVWRNRDPELRALAQARYIPNFVFLDSAGNKVFETRGFNNEREAIAVHAFVSQKLYLQTTFAEYLRSLPDS